jgi:Flp pilus assembly protein TadD
VVVLVLTAIVYLPALNGDFVNWDDNDYVYTNARLRQGSLGAALSYFCERDASGGFTLPEVQGNYHPLTMLSLAVDLALSGVDQPKRGDRETDLRAGAFHTTNVALHLANTALVFAFVTALLAAIPDRRWAGRPRPQPSVAAFVAALLFGIATLHVESVAWVAERKDVLYTFFFLISLLLYLRYVRTGRTALYAAALATFAASLLAKGQAVTLAPTLVALDVLLDRRTTRGRGFWDKIPFFALAFCFGGLAIGVQMGHGNVLGRAARYPFHLRPFFASYALVQYVVKLAVPFHLLAYYPYTLALAHRWALYAVYPPLAAGLLVLGVYAIRRAPVYAFGLAFFVVNVATVLQFLPVGGAVMADRYSYVPSIGIFLAAGVAGASACGRWRRHVPAMQAVFAVYMVAIAVVTWDRVRAWHDSRSLWTDELQRNPESAIAYNNLATFRFYTDDLPGALADATRAVTLDPEWSKPYMNRGMIRDFLGQPALARADYDRTLELQPNQPSVLNNRGLLRLDAGDRAGAIDDFSRAIALQPAATKFYGNRGKALAAAGRPVEAMADYAFVLARDPDPELYSNRAMLRAQEGDPAGAVADFSEVVRRLPDSPFPYLNRAKARLVLVDCRGAREDVAAAARLGPVPAAAREELDVKCPDR